MAILNSSNSSVDNNSGAVMFHRSPELIEIMKLRKEVESLNNKMDLILSLLKGGGDNSGVTMEK